MPRFSSSSSSSRRFLLEMPKTNKATPPLASSSSAFKPRRLRHSVANASSEAVRSRGKIQEASLGALSEKILWVVFGVLFGFI